ncbi:type II toxin-antitoxin system Phd/YefM family antitoxin [Truepera radiovictrix]|uniref:Antitoxin n=2 Tax=Truepera TaxID=332248 RepID=D7CQB1_TRURR|nr:type II toxin-antitoxin system prevent-host-death family antitoxin [Truepera radiovictrix]ADI14895.1 prevent-host-death family protein [Truepera radiovictrix DSM 17093]
MPMTNVAEAKAQLSSLIEKALAGEEVIISKHGKPMVRLVPYERDASPRDMSVRIWEGEVRLADDFDELPAELMTAFSGDAH